MNVAQRHQTPEVVNRSWGHEFLDWFSTLGIPMVERQFDLGSLRYFHFASSFTVKDGRQAHSFGSDKNRFLAALKCAAETVERETMVDYFCAHPTGAPLPSKQQWVGRKQFG